MKATAKSLVASLVMGVVSYYTYHYLIRFTNTGGEKEFVVLFMAVVIGAIIYCGLIILFKIDETKIAIDVLKNKIKRA